MEAFANLLMGFTVALSPQHLMLAFVGSLLGTLIGVLPGSAQWRARRCHSLDLQMAPTGAMHLLTPLLRAAIWLTITSVPLNVPGEAASAITCLDGYAMAKQGEPGSLSPLRPSVRSLGERSPLCAWFRRPDRSPGWRWSSVRWNFSLWSCWESPY